MAGRGSKKESAQARVLAERARVYQARTQWHEGRGRRRIRDNVIAIVAGVILVVGVFVSQGLHAAMNAPEPSPSPSIAPTP